MSNNIISDFDIILDTDIGIFNVIKSKYNNPKYFNSDLINNIEIDALVYNIINCKYDNILDIFINEEYKNQTKSLYNQILREEQDMLYKNSLITEILNLFKVYLESGVINITILCKNKLEEQIINKIDSRFNTIIYNDSEINCDIYDTIFLKKYKDIIKFKNVLSKNIFISNQANNLDKDKNLPLMDISLIIGRSNKIYTIDLYQIEKILG